MRGRILALLLGVFVISTSVIGLYVQSLAATGTAAATLSTNLTGVLAQMTAINAFAIDPFTATMTAVGTLAGVTVATQFTTLSTVLPQPWC